MTLQSNRDASTPDVPWKNPSARPWQTGGAVLPSGTQVAAGLRGGAPLCVLGPVTVTR